MQVSEWPTEFVENLARDFRVICFENRDMGLSGRCGPNDDSTSFSKLCSDDIQPSAPYTLFDMRDDILRGLEHLCVKDFAIIGFSMGGMIAQLVAAHAKQRVTGFAQICSSAGEATAPFPKDALQRFLRTSKGFEAEPEMIDWLTEDLVWCSTPSSLSITEARKAAQTMIASGFSSGGYARQLLAILTAGDRQAHLAEIDACSLIIAGNHDRCIETHSSHRAHEIIQNSSLIVFDNMGHALEPRVLASLSAWLRETLECPH